MRIAVIRVPSDADGPWLWDRLQWAQSPRVLLVLPREGPAYMQGVLPWVQVARRARGLGLQVAVVTRNRPMARWVEEAGLPVFPSVEAAYRRVWRIPRRRRRRRRGPRGRAALAETARFLGLPRSREQVRAPLWTRAVSGVLALLALALLAGFLGPQARVVLPVTARKNTREVQVLLSPDFQGVVPSVRGLPLEAMVIEVEGWRVVRATGVTRVPTDTARVSLLWTSLTNRTVVLPAGLRVRDVEGQMDFVLEEGGTLPPGPGTTLLLKARAVRPGEEGNLPPHRLRLVDPPWDQWVTVTNPAPATGGASIALSTVTLQDRDRTLDELSRWLWAKAEALAPLRVPPGGAMVPGSLRATGVLEVHVQPPVGSPAVSAVLYARQRFRLWVVPKEALEALAAGLLVEATEPGWRLWPGTLRFDLRVAKKDGPPYTGTLTVQWWEVPQLDTRQVAWALAVRPVAWVQRGLAEWPWLVKAPQVELTPSGWPWMPAGFRTQVVVRPVMEGE